MGSYLNFVRQNIFLLSAAALVFIIATVSVYEVQANEQERRFEEISDKVIEKIETTVAAWIALGDSGRTLLQLSEGVTSSFYWEYSEYLIESFPVIQYADYTPRITSSERVQFEAVQLAEHGTDYAIRDFNTEGQLVPASERSEYYPASDGRLLGWDLSADPIIGPALIASRDSSLPTSALIRSPLDNEQFRIVIVYPFFDRAAEAFTTEDSRSIPVGFTFVVMGVTELIDEATTDNSEEISVEVFGDIGGENTKLYSIQRQDGQESARTYPLTILDSEWTVMTSPLPGLSGRWPKSFPIVFAIVFGIGISAAAVAVALISTQRRNALALAGDLQELSESKTRFLSTVSHELKTPLTSVIAFTDLVLRNKESNLTEKQLNQLAVVRRNSDHLNVLINDLLDVSRIHAGNLRVSLSTFDAAVALRQTLESLQHVFDDKKQVYRTDVPDAPIWLNADQDRIEQVVTNLLMNAAKYSPEGAEITFSASVDEDNLVFTVQDNGIGISEQELSEVFEPFYRSDNAGTNKESGTGLGLYITASIVDMHGGTVEIDSDVGTGTKVTVTIPGVASDSVGRTFGLG